MGSFLPTAGLQEPLKQEPLKGAEQDADREQKARLELLQALLAAANAANTIQEAKSAALTLICRHTGWPVGHVYRHCGGRLVPTMLWGGDAAEAVRFARWREITAATVFAPGEGLPGCVLTTRRPAWVRDVAENPGFARDAAAAEVGLHAAIAFPVLIGTEVEAVLEFFSERVEEPDEGFLELLAYVGAQFGHVVERQRLLRRHELILGAAGEGIYGLDADGRTTFVNPTAAALVGWPAEALLGRPQHAVIHHSYPDGSPYPAEACPIEAVLRDGQERRVSGEVFWRRDGTSFPVEYVATPLHEGDEIVGVVVVFHDISEREELKALQAAEQALREEAHTLEVINDVNISIAAELDREKLVQTVTDAGTLLTGAEFGAFFYNVVDGRGERYTLYALSGAEREAFSRFPMPRNTPIFHSTFSGEGVVRLDDVMTDPRYGRNPPYYGMPAGHLPVRSYLAVPVKSSGGEVIGGLFFGHPEPGAFDARDEQIAVAIASQAAVALQNADLYAHARASEGQLLALIDNLPGLAWTARPDGYIDFYNRRWYEYTGTTFEEVKGWGWGKVHDPEILPEVVARWKHSLETGEPFEMEFPLRGADGTFRWFLTRVNALRDAEGHITRWVGTNTDVDEQKRTAAALEEARGALAEANRRLEERVEERTAKLRESEALLHSVTANVLDGIAALEAVRDDEGRIVDFRWLLVNPQAEAIYGHPADALVGALQSEVLPEVKAMGLHDALARVVETGEPLRQEVSSDWKPGRKPGRWFHLSVSKLGDGVVALFREITEAKEAEAALRASEMQLREAQKLAHVGSWQWDVVTDRVTWSDELYRIFGFVPGEIAVDYARYAACLYPDDRAVMEATIQKAVAEKEGYEVTHRIIRPDGTVRWILSFGEVVIGGDGAVVALQGTAQDVTERVEAEHALQRYARELEESNEELAKFAYIASHDLQEPLRMVASFLQLLERRYEGQLDEAAREYIGYAVDGARRMQRLIQDLLAYSRVGTRGKDFEPVDSRETILDVLHDLGPAIHDSGAEVEMGALPTVFADPTQLHQLLLNLVGNALKFRREGVSPHIRIDAEPARLEDGHPGWRFTVTDNGIGIDPRYGERIFQVFQRLHTREEYEGTGIGLAICKKIVERHGGTIAVTSAPGQGATFSFTLPSPPEAKPAATPPSTTL